MAIQWRTIMTKKNASILLVWSRRLSSAMCDVNNTFLAKTFTVASYTGAV